MNTKNPMMKKLRAIRSILFRVAASALLIGAASGADQPPLRATGGFVVAGLLKMPTPGCPLPND